MNWYYVADGKSVGPIGDEAFKNLVNAGAITMETMVWNETMTEWKPYREVAPASQRLRLRPPGQMLATPSLREPGQMLAQSATEGVCVSCGNVFPKDEMLPYEDKLVCARCKPIFVQRLKEGVHVGGAGADSVALTQEIIERDYDIDIGGCIGRAWETLKANFWLVIGVSLLVWLASAAIGAIGGVINAFAPIYGQIIQQLLTMVFTGPLLGGLYWFYICLLRGREAGIEQGFKGFGPRFVQLMLANVVSTLLIYALYIPALACFGVVVAKYWGNLNQIETMMPTIWADNAPLIIAGGVLAFVAILVSIYLTIAWIFILPLVIDKQVGFWEAMQTSRKVVSRHWWKMLGFLFVVGLVMLLGYLACCVGAIASIPLGFMAIMCVYEDIFNRSW